MPCFAARNNNKSINNSNDNNNNNNSMCNSMSVRVSCIGNRTQFGNNCTSNCRRNCTRRSQVQF